MEPSVAIIIIIIITQKLVINTWQKVLKLREMKLKIQEQSSYQASPDLSGASYTYNVRNWI